VSGFLEERASGRAVFWAALLGVLAGWGLAALGWWVLRPPSEVMLTLLPPPTPPPWQVHVDGAVQRPGVYVVRPGARVIDAVTAAGGLRPEADTRAINLAAPLEDGARVWIPRRGETPPAAPTRPARGAVSPQTPAARLNLNTATAAELEALPGIGPALAQRIVEYREQHGPFTTVEDLLAVSGIGPAKLEQLRPYITVEDSK